MACQEFTDSTFATIPIMDNQIVQNNFVANTEMETETKETEEENDTNSLLMIHTIALQCPLPHCSIDNGKLTTHEVKNCHLAEHHRVLCYRCAVNDCLALCASKSELLNHVNLVHPTGTPLGCRQCSPNVTFFDYRHLSLHYFTMHEAGSFQCCYARDPMIEDSFDCTFMGKTRSEVILHACSEHAFRCATSAINENIRAELIPSETDSENVVFEPTNSEFFLVGEEGREGCTDSRQPIIVGFFKPLHRNGEKAHFLDRFYCRTKKATSKKYKPKNNSKNPSFKKLNSNGHRIVTFNEAQLNTLQQNNRVDSEKENNQDGILTEDEQTVGLCLTLDQNQEGSGNDGCRLVIVGELIGDSIQPSQGEAGNNFVYANEASSIETKKGVKRKINLTSTNKNNVIEGKYSDDEICEQEVEQQIEEQEKNKRKTIKYTYSKKMPVGSEEEIKPPKYHPPNMEGTSDDVENVSSYNAVEQDDEVNDPDYVENEKQNKNNNQNNVFYIQANQISTNPEMIQFIDGQQSGETHRQSEHPTVLYCDNTNSLIVSDVAGEQQPPQTELSSNLEVGIEMDAQTDIIFSSTDDAIASKQVQQRAETKSSSTQRISKPFKCTYPECMYQCAREYNLLTHVRVTHFKLPATEEEQRAKMICDTRDPRDYMRVLSDNDDDDDNSDTNRVGRQTRSGNLMTTRGQLRQKTNTSFFSF